MLIGILIMAVFAVGATILLFTTPSDADALGEGPAIVEPEEKPEENVLPPEYSPPPVETPTPTIAPEQVTSIVITYGGNPIRDNDFSQPKGVPIELGVRVEPVGIDAPVEWSGVTVGDIEWEDIYEFTLVVGGIRIEGHEAGIARIKASAGDMETTVIVRIT